MNKDMNILVTGCGGDIGQSIGKVLNELPFVGKLYGCDLNLKSASKFIFPNFFQSVSCKNESYIDFLVNTVKMYDIDLVIPISELEIRFFSKNNNYANLGFPILLPNRFAMDVGFDKLKTIELLKKYNLPYPKTFLIENLLENKNDIIYPSIVKSKNGSGSKSVYVVKSFEDFTFYVDNCKDFIVQEKIQGDDNEYTCGLFRSRLGEVRSIIIKRELTGGFTGYGEVIHDITISNFLIELAFILDLRGSINVQLKYYQGVPYVFEINPRFSSTVRFRDISGFKDVKWAIQDLFEQQLDEYETVIEGTKFYKGYNEYIEKL